MESEEEEEVDDARPIIFDNGSDTVRVGYAGEDKPCCVFPNLIARLKHRGFSYIIIIYNNS